MEKINQRYTYGTLLEPLSIIKSGVSLLYSREGKGNGDQGPTRKRNPSKCLPQKELNAADCWRHSGRGKQVPVRQPTGEQEPEATATFRRRKRAWGHPWKPAPGGPSRDGRSCRKGNSLRSHPCPTGRPRKGQERLLGPRNDPRMFHGGNRLQSKSQLRTLLKQVSDFPTAGLVKALTCSQTRDL